MTKKPLIKHKKPTDSYPSQVRNVAKKSYGTLKLNSHGVVLVCGHLCGDTGGRLASEKTLGFGLVTTNNLKKSGAVKSPSPKKVT